MDARNKLARENLKLVHWVLHRLLNRGYFYLIQHNRTTKEDLFGAGCIGLAKAIEKYDSTKGTFSTFAVPHIEGNIKHYIRDRCQTAGIKVHRDDIKNKKFPEKTNQTIKCLEISRRYTPLFELNRQDRELLNELLSGLNQKDQIIIRAVMIDGLTHKEAGKLVGCSSPTVCRRVRKGLVTLKKLAKE